MHYVLETGGPPERVVLVGRRRAERAIMIVFFVIAPLLAFISLGAFAEGETALGLALVGFASFLLSVAILIARTPPLPRLIFDQGARTLTVTEERPTRRMESLSLGEFAGFAVIPQQMDQRLVYVVALLRHDAALWSLFRTTSQDKAEAFRVSLSRRVHFEDRTARVPAPREAWGPSAGPTEPFVITERGDTTTIEWRPPGTFGNAVLGILCVAGFALGFVGCIAMSASRGNTIAGAVVAGALLLLCGYALLASPKREVIEVTPDVIRYVRRSRLFVPGRFEMPLSEIHAIQLYLAGAASEQLLFVLTAAQVESFKRIYQGIPSLTELVELAKARLGAARIRLHGLSPVAMIRLEQILQAVIRQHGGHSGL